MGYWRKFDFYKEKRDFLGKIRDRECSIDEPRTEGKSIWNLY